jgi:DNA-binding CsgD family transcriptional regulator
MSEDENRSYSLLNGPCNFLLKELYIEGYRTAPVPYLQRSHYVSRFSKIGGIDPAGRAFFLSTVGGELCAAIMHRPTKFSDIAERFAALSDRQRQVAALVCDGLSNRVIAEKLGLTEGTVKAHLHAIYEGLGIESRIALMVALADGRSRSPASGQEQGTS